MTYLVLKLSVFLIVLPLICLSHFVIWVSTGLQAPIYLEALGFAEEKVRLGTSSLYKAKKKRNNCTGRAFTNLNCEENEVCSVFICTAGRKNSQSWLEFKQIENELNILSIFYSCLFPYRDPFSKR